MDMRSLINLLESAKTPVIRRATPADVDGIADCFDRNFEHTGFSANAIIGPLLRPGNISFVVEDNGEIVGFYVLRAENIPDLEVSVVKNLDQKLYAQLKSLGNGIEGVCLGLDAEYRGKGIGNELKDLPKTLGYSYIWGLQLAMLNNLDAWLKRRKLLAAGSGPDGIHLTAEIF